MVNNLRITLSTSKLFLKLIVSNYHIGKMTGQHFDPLQKNSLTIKFSVNYYYSLSFSQQYNPGFDLSRIDNLKPMTYDPFKKVSILSICAGLNFGKKEGNHTKMTLP